MAWEVLLIPLVILGVWILSAIFRGSVDLRDNNRPRRGGPDEAPRPLRRPATELDRFLEEARRRKTAQNRPAESAERPAEPVAERPRPAPPPPEPRPARPVERERRPPPRRPPLAEPVVVAKPVPPAPVASAPAPAPPPTAAPVVSVPATQPRALNPVLVQLVGMLKQKSSVRAAMILREVLDRPLCERGRRH